MPINIKKVGVIDQLSDPTNKNYPKLLKKITRTIDEDKLQDRFFGHIPVTETPSSSRCSQGESSWVYEILEKQVTGYDIELRSDYPAGGGVIEATPETASNIGRKFILIITDGANDQMLVVDDVDFTTGDITVSPLDGSENLASAVTAGTIVKSLGMNPDFCDMSNFDCSYSILGKRKQVATKRAECLSWNATEKEGELNYNVRELNAQEKVDTLLRYFYRIALLSNLIIDENGTNHHTQGIIPMCMGNPDAVLDGAGVSLSDEDGAGEAILNMAMEKLRNNKGSANLLVLNPAHVTYLNNYFSNTYTTENDICSEGCETLGGAVLNPENFYWKTVFGTVKVIFDEDFPVDKALLSSTSAMEHSFLPLTKGASKGVQMETKINTDAVFEDCGKDFWALKYVFNAWGLGQYHMLVTGITV